MKWTYVSKKHYSRPDGRGGTIHVASGAVYITHPSKATVDVTGAEAEKYVTSATGKPPRAEPRREKPTAPTKPPTASKPTAPAKRTKKSFLASAKKGAKLVVAGMKPVAAAAAKYGGRVAAAGEIVVSTTAAAEARALAPPPAKKAKKAKKPPAKKAKKPPAKKASSAKAVTKHPLAYLVGGGEALPPISHHPAAKKKRAQTCREFMGY